MFVRRSDRPVAPVCADLVCERRDDHLEKPLVAERDKPALKRLSKRPCVEALYGVQAFGAENRAGIHRTANLRALRESRFIDEALNLFRP